MGAEADFLLLLWTHTQYRKQVVESDPEHLDDISKRLLYELRTC